jgi:hypothetical protein
MFFVFVQAKILQIVYLTSSCLNWARECQKMSNLYTSELNTTFFVRRAL